jgi:hypothetical protein
MNIPKVYLDQALKPRGQTINERLNFIIDWYRKSANNVTPSDKHQAKLIELMGSWANKLQNEVLSDTNEQTSFNISSLLDSIADYRINSKSSAETSFFYYLHIELSRVIDIPFNTTTGV